MKKNIPIASKWLLDAAGETGRSAITSVYMIVCQKTSKKGTGFLLKDGPIITNAHVIEGCQTTDVLAYSHLGERVLFSKATTCPQKDLAILVPKNKLDGGLLLGPKKDPKVGNIVSTWGFPLGYNGPAPLLSVGFLSGYQQTESGVKYLVVNGAFNPGNSGGPLFMAENNLVVGVVVSKHAPIGQFHLSALNVLANNRSGIIFTATDEKGKSINFAESQLVAELLEYFRGLTQVMIGEAISVSELRTFLAEQNLEEPK